MLTSDDWRTAIETEVREILQQAQVRWPPVDAIGVARALKLTIAWDQSQGGRGRIAKIAGRPTIFLRPDERPERLQWAAAHELGESCVWRICRALGVAGDELLPRQREELANLFAKQLLLPAETFERDSRNCDFDLLQLKTRYATASHELIACRWLDAERSGIVTIVDQGAVTYRRSNLSAKIHWTADEKTCWSQLRRMRRPQRVQSARMSIRGWCIDSPDWQREILYAMVSTDDDSAAE